MDRAHSRETFYHLPTGKKKKRASQYFQNKYANGHQKKNKKQHIQLREKPNKR